ncbi:effector-associated domain 2-containing protein [Pseudofrankia saprophytica]|uniref:VMAP-C domain-containing protein n=1 Tax=Pseudofrankia saprophytica TaxID=298655 RepID=UPI000234CB79|nr:hypothetical protein [Pseudofrankia saprophytica]
MRRRRASAEMAIAELLATAPVLHGEQSRRLLLSRLSQRSETRLDVSDYPTGRQWFLGLVSVCDSSLVGLAHLPAAAGDLGLADATLAELSRLADRWEASEALADASDDLLARLETALTTTAPATVAHAYRLALGGLAVSPPTHCDTAWAVLLHLAGRNAPLGALPPYLAFLDQVGVLLTPAITNQVGRFLRRQVNGAGLADQLADAHGRRTAQVGLVHLILQFERSELVDGQVEMTCWRQWPGIEGFEPCGTRLGSNDDLEAMAEDAIGELEELLAEGEQLVALEFILPRPLLDLPVEHWRTENDTTLPRPIGLRYPVVLRSLERQRRRRGQREWRLRWRALTKGATGFAHCDAFGVGGGEHDHDRLQTRFLREDAMVALVLSGPPREDLAASELDIALNCGVPVVVWHRGSRTEDAIAAAIQAFLGSATGGAGLTDLRERARRLRVDAHLARPDWPDLGRHLALMWEDPDRQPEQGPEIAAPMARRR